MSRRSFGKIRKLASGRWQASYVGVDQQRHVAPVTYSSKIDAEGWLRDERRLVESDDWTSPNERASSRRQAERTVTFDDYSDRWISTRRTLKGAALRPATVAGYRTTLERYLEPTFGGFELKDISKEAVRSWYATLDASQPRATSKAYGLLRAIMNSAVDDDLIPVSPVHIRGAGATQKRRQLEPATVAELAVIAAEMPERLRLMIHLASWCALRYGEIAALRRSDVRITSSEGTARATIRVRRGVVFLSGSKQVAPPKSEAGVRDVAVPPHVVPILKEHLKTHCAKGADGLMFPAEGGGFLWPSVMERHFRRARAAAGRPDLRFHDLRHTGAVLAAQQGATIADLQARLGHSTAAAALLYQHTATGRDQLIADRLSALLD